MGLARRGSPIRIPNHQPKPPIYIIYHQLNIPYLLALLKIMCFFPFGGMFFSFPGPGFSTVFFFFSPLARGQTMWTNSSGENLKNGLTLRITGPCKKEGFGCVFCRVLLDLQTPSFEIFMILRVQYFEFGELQNVGRRFLFQNWHLASLKTWGPPASNDLGTPYLTIAWCG